MHKRRFIWAYFVMVLYGVVMLSATIYTGTHKTPGIISRAAPGLTPISNNTAPNVVDEHFNQHPVTKVPATTFGFPDGTCYVYSNKSSWAVMECFGGINSG